MTDQEIATLIGYASQWWPNFRSPESLATMIRSWRVLLADVPFDAGAAALSEHSASGAEFPPPVGVIRRRAAELTAPAGLAPSVDEAWGEVLEQIARVGYTTVFGRELKFSHPAIAAVVAALGWEELLMSTNQVADRAHFARMYAERIERDLRVRAEPPVVTSVRQQAQLEAADGPRSIAVSLPSRETTE